MDFTDCSTAEIVFEQQLSCSKYSVLFLVTIRGHTLVLKVHHGRGPKQYYESDDRETNFHICEANAYKRLRNFGLGERGIVPRFYGTIDDLDPKLCQPHLDMFSADEYPPKGILLEYIPNMEPLHWTRFTKERMRNFMNGIKEIHKAGVEHSDVNPRNMMIIKDDPQRAIWIDFDRAQTFDRIEKQQKEWIDFEDALVSEMADFMKEDFVNQRMKQTTMYYY